ncbi:MAG: DUF3516 domain-containing protein [Corynebacterium sp.]|nr:DUF3516 domain-containing protein [Corynebacterium sp.]
MSLSPRTLTEMLPDLAEVPADLVDESIFESFAQWTASRGISLYPAQEEATLGILTGDNIILSTPTGSGKSLVATAAHFIALAREQRSFYTAPIKALVSEKFFALCSIFGPDKVGMMTGDATVNASAPIICATAEIVANMALRSGANAPVDQVIMDEFHFYADPQRGWAWQVPLLELPQCQFLLMSATLGDTDALAADLTERTGRPTSRVSGFTRPVPLDFHYVYTPVHETVHNLLKAGTVPVYIVHFSQREATERAQALSSMTVCTPEEKAAIAAAIGSFRFTTTFGKTLSRLLRMGIGIHHAGMLPKYRLLVEKLSQEGLLKVICGTDTLGVGINVPIRTVLFTSLVKYDGQRQRIVSSREFHQIAGRAGRAGYDTEGTVIIEAPDHEIENFRLRNRSAADQAKLAKKRKAHARPGEVTWTDSTFEKLTTSQPERLTSQFRVTSSLMLEMMARPLPHYPAFAHLLRTSHNSRTRQNRDIVAAIELFRGLIEAGVVTATAGDYQLTEDLPPNFALNQPLGPFALAALELLDPESDTFTLDVLSVVEAICENPRRLLAAQLKAERNRENQALKDEGVDYTERQILLDEVTWPRPLGELLDTAFETYAHTHPWVREFELTPKSVVRYMVEHGLTFSDMIAEFGLSRTEGELLRYLTDLWRTLRRSVPDSYYTEELDDIVVWLGELIAQVDSSLIDEWATMSNPDAPIDAATVERESVFGVVDPTALSANRRAFTIMIRNFFFRLVEMFALEDEDGLEAVVADFLPSERPDFSARLDDYFADYDDLDISPAARGPEYFRITDDTTRQWSVRQTMKDPLDDRSFAFVGVVDLDASDAAGEVVLSSLHIDAA